MSNLIAGIGSAAGSLISSIGGLQNAHVANSIERQNLAFQQSAHSQNYQHTLNQFEYQKQLQRQIFGREDNSIQRRIADLKAAGLSPVLAAGQGARAGAVVQTKAPHLTPSQRTIQGKALAQQAILQAGEVGRTFAETKLILAQARQANAQADKTQTEGEISKIQLSEWASKQPYFDIHSVMNASISTANANYKEAQADMATIDMEWKRALKDWIESESGSRTRLTPAEIEYRSTLAYMQIKQIDKDFAERMRSMKIGGDLGRIIIPLLKMFAK